MEKITVRVPATTANLGPGFDSLGCALGLYNTISFTKTSEGLSFKGCEDEFKTHDNLAFLAFDAVMKRAGKETVGLEVSFDSTDIPVSRGLGSSASLICGGAIAANAFCGNPFSKAELLAVCTPIEGHPDNLSPAFYGGLTASLTENGNPVSVSYPVHPSLRFVALIPPFRLSTRLARSVLPREIAFADAVYNVSRTAVLLGAMTNGNKDLLRLALSDRLHEPYRKPLIDGFDTSKRLAVENGAIGFCLSGAGPTCLCLCDDEAFAGKIESSLKNAGLDWAVADLPVDRKGATIL